MHVREQQAKESKLRRIMDGFSGTPQPCGKGFCPKCSKSRQKSSIEVDESSESNVPLTAGTFGKGTALHAQFARCGKYVDGVVAKFNSVPFHWPHGVLAAEVAQTRHRAAEISADGLINHAQIDLVCSQVFGAQGAVDRFPEGVAARGELGRIACHNGFKWVSVAYMSQSSRDQVRCSRNPCQDIGRPGYCFIGFGPCVRCCQGCPTWSDADARSTQGFKRTCDGPKTECGLDPRKEQMSQPSFANAE